MGKRWVRLVVVGTIGASALGMTACAAPTVTWQPDEPSASPEEWGRGDPIEEPELTPPTPATVTMTDPVAQSFSVQVPEGWDSIAYSTGTLDDHREAVVSVSPDGNTVLFLGDPKLPGYWDPDHPNNQADWIRQWVDQSDVAEFRTYVHAVDWTQEWVQRKFGGLDGFALGATTDDPAQAQEFAAEVQQATGSPVQVTVAHTDFTYDTESGTVSARVGGVTMNGGQAWYADVQGLSTLGLVDDYEPMLSAMARSKQTDPGWAARRDAVWAQQRAQSEAFTQQLIANHNANMAWIQNSAAAHQSRMQAIWSANDASMQSYYSRMETMDDNQRSFLNYINEENTVSGPTGQTWQVATGQENYYVNPTTGEYVAGDINFDDQDLLAMGLNPSDYELTQIIR